MARKGRRGGGYRNNPYNRKAYQFTSRRRAALKRAQALSAKKKKMNRVKVGIMAVGGVAAVGAIAYMGRNTAVGKGVRRDVAKQVRKFSPSHVGRAQNLKRARAAVNPLNKEAVRMAGAVSPATVPGGYPSHIFGPQAAHVPGAAPGFVKGDPSTYRREDLGKEDPSVMRTQLANEAAWKEHMGIFEKFTDPGDGAVTRLLHGKKITKSAYTREIKKRNKEAIKAGGQGMTPLEMETHINMMVAGGHLRTKTTGRDTPIRTNPQAVPHATAPNSGVTAAQAAATMPQATPVQPVSSTPSFITVPGLGNAQSPFGSKTAGTAPLTPAQKGAETRRRNAAAKRAAAEGRDAKPASQPTVQFSDAPKPHAPSAAPGSWDAIVGKVHPEWPLEGNMHANTKTKRRIKNKATAAGYYINFRTGIVDRIP